MNLTPEVMMWIIGGLITACWLLLMWRLGNMESNRKQDNAHSDGVRTELRDGMKVLFGRLEDHVKDDGKAFTDIRENMHSNHVELLGLLGNRRGDK